MPVYDQIIQQISRILVTVLIRQNAILKLLEGPHYSPQQIRDAMSRAQLEIQDAARTSQDASGGPPNLQALEALLKASGELG